MSEISIKNDQSSTALYICRALTGKYPPKIRMYSKYERRTDTRTYDDRRKLYEGGWDVLYAELLEKSWKEKMDEWTGRAKCKFRC